ncbi:MAG TPA: TlpA disulfide reductase family protein [Thermoanaerobaculia bacterium]|nr:TlpA disulfide reductase family protein [Thermoanaerobaculia bacterium]
MNAPSVLLALLLPLPWATAPAAAAEPSCQPEVAVEAVLKAAGTPDEILELSGAAWRERLDLVETALEQHPGDLFLHRERQDLYRWGPKEVRAEELPGLIEEYAALREEHPGAPQFLYLFGRITDDPELEGEAFAAAVAADPDFPWGHLGLVADLLSRQDQEGEDKTDVSIDRITSHLARFLELCPDRLYEALVNHRGIDAPAFWNERLPGFRETIRGAPAEHLKALPPLWELEFRLAELSEHAQVRERIAGDLAAVEALGSEERPVLALLQEGYGLAGQAEKAAEVEARLQELAPCSREAVSAVMMEWTEGHPMEGPERTEEERQALDLEFTEATWQWVERCPEDWTFWSARLEALSRLDDAEPSEIVAAGDRVAELYGQFRGYAFPTGYEQAAKVFVDRGLALGRVTELLDLAEAEAQRRREDQDRFLQELPEDQRREIERSDAYADWRRDLLRARGRVVLGELGPGSALLGELGSRLEELAPGEEAKSQEGLSHAGHESAFFEAQAELAEAEGRLPDAVAYLLRAVAVKPPAAPGWVQGPTPADARERAAELWSRLGGTPDGLAALERPTAGGAESGAALADYSPWTEGSGPLPDFELIDLSGGVWKLADLKGKTVFANAWATWCAPCRKELPVVQALHERLKDREDVVVVTLNMDSNLGAVVPYMTKEGFTFPALFAFDYLSEDAEVLGIPQSWILDGTGTVRFEQSGYDSSVADEDWLADVEERLERVGGAGD